MRELVVVAAAGGGVVRMRGTRKRGRLEYVGGCVGFWCGHVFILENFAFV